KHHSAKHDAGAGDVPRIQELAAKVRALEAERETWKARTVSPEGIKNIPAAPQPPAPAPPKPPPSVEQFDSYDAYVAALTDYKIEQAIAAADAKRAEAERQRQLEAETARVRSSWNA